MLTTDIDGVNECRTAGAELIRSGKHISILHTSTAMHAFN